MESQTVEFDLMNSHAVPESRVRPDQPPAFSPPFY